MMNKTKKYQKILCSCLTEYATQFENDIDNLTTIPVLDKENHHYQIVIHGFRGEKFFYTVQFHIDIINEKVSILRNISDFPIEEELIKRGIPKSDIVFSSMNGYEKTYSKRKVMEKAA